MTKARYGRVVNISSVVGEMGNPGQANYCASKAGLFGLTKSAARELAKRNITVNAVAPGFIETDMTAGLPEKGREALLQNIPMERLGSVDDVAHAVSFLVSPEAGYITGQVLSVNGGMYM
jgi:3-oxoacyl-[acyl-carrier protein] reductase